VLEVGAGSSRLSEDLYRDGIQHITCTDLSKVAVERMRERFVDLPGLQLFLTLLMKFPCHHTLN
jgi:16S rRNA A1518/A1519 N6-dimethyltransferase RsmA/KsgA/DIM1 with predicted DNA glycosylase/AP lyase activity